jgi:malonate-semialdehyde dehydrogenase (acetylating) / methylmalonate-semialdehyde dehydrogenase
VRSRYMFKLKALLEKNFETLAKIITVEHGKIIDEARGEVRRAIENVELAAGIPSLMMGYSSEDVAVGIDEECIMQPMGVFCCVAPFNFPAMVPFWFLPTAIACGNTYIVKPSDTCPMTSAKLFEILDDCGFPEGVVNMVNGGKEVVDSLLTHPDIVGVSFVGSTPVGRYIYATAAANGKRAQCQAGAKNSLVVMPDAPLDSTVSAILTSSYGTAGQRCLAGSLVLAVGDCYEPLRDKLVEVASKLKIGNGLDESVQMGPLVSLKSKERVLSYIEKGLQEKAELILDGRKVQTSEPNGFFVGPTIFDKVTPEMTIAREEIFGPVLGIIHVKDFGEALSVIDGIPYGNAGALFTTSGKTAREFKYRAHCGNIGINIGVPAPIATFPFAGMKQSFFGDLHGQGKEGIQFFTDRKVIISRW